MMHSKQQKPTSQDLAFRFIHYPVMSNKKQYLSPSLSCMRVHARTRTHSHTHTHTQTVVPVCFTHCNITVYSQLYLTPVMKHSSMKSVKFKYRSSWSDEYLMLLSVIGSKQLNPRSNQSSNKNINSNPATNIQEIITPIILTVHPLR